MIKKYRENRMKKLEISKIMIKIKNYILKGQRNANYYDRIILKSKDQIIKLILYLINEFK